MNRLEKLWHITFSSDGRLPLFAGEAGRLSALHRLAAVAGREAILYSIVDDHLHLLVLCCRARVSRRVDGTARRATAARPKRA